MSQMIECTRYYTKSKILSSVTQKMRIFTVNQKILYLCQKIWFHIISALSTRNNSIVITIAELAKVHQRR